MKISHKLLLSFLVVASLTSLTTFFTLQSYNVVDRSFQRLIDVPTRKIETLNALRVSGLRIVASTSEFAFVQAESQSLSRVEVNEEKAIGETEEVNEAEIQLATQGYQKYDIALQQYDDLVKADGGTDISTLERIRSAGFTLIGLSGQLMDLKKRGVTGHIVLIKKEEFESAEKVFLETVNTAISLESADQRREQAVVHSAIDLATTETIAVTAAAFLSAIILGFYISLSISRRVGKLRSASEKWGNGQFETQVDVNGKDEIGELAHSFNKMAADLLASHDQLVSSKAFTDNVISSIADALFVMNADLTVIRVNAAAVNLTGFAAEELIGTSIKILRPDGAFFDEDDMHELMAGSRVSSVETHLVNKDNRAISVLLSASLMPGKDGEHEGIVCVARDISELKELEHQLTHQALHDPLTNLANRVLFRDRVEHAYGRMNRSKEPFAVLFLDLDNFKMINDTLGHSAGDELLVSVAKRLQACLRASDTAARMGGDEFAILVEDTTKTGGALSVAERVLDTLKTPFVLEGKEIFVGTSIGIAATDTGSDDADALLRNADVAMYIAKSRGKGGYTVFETEMHEVLLKRAELENDIQRALERGEFELYYQPIIDLQSEKMTGMEALLRWNHPTLGLIPPLDFIPIAEETGLIIPLGRWVLETACAQAGKWQREYGREDDLSITVNVSSRQFRDETLIQLVGNALESADLRAHNLILEITESTMLQNTANTIQKLQELKEIGVRLAIDDFGTGYSSLSYLQRFPLDILKIDKSFIDRICEGMEGAAVTRAIITMGDTLHLKTIAEGIESLEQTEALQGLGCEMGQGYHFARPMTSGQMAKFLHDPTAIKTLAEQMPMAPQPAATDQSLHLTFS